jgi:hypothetical protein
MQRSKAGLTWRHVTQYLSTIDADPIERRMRENISV